MKCGYLLLTGIASDYHIISMVGIITECNVMTGLKYNGDSHNDACILYRRVFRTLIGEVRKGEQYKWGPIQLVL